MSVPLSAAFRPFGRVPQSGRLAAKLPRQLLHSWYLMYFQLPWLPERSAKWVVPKLWRDWSPDYHADEDLQYVDAAIGAPDQWRAALGYYRATVRGTKPPAQYAELNKHWLSAPLLPTLYLHGTDDGCTEDYTPWIERVLPEHSQIALIANGGHFLQLDQPDAVARHIVDFVGRAAA
jgi:pimeloyl-ACP methyl ester carboxylesterase